MKQTTHTILMVSPDTFGFNPQTAQTNIYQHKPTEKEESIRAKAQQEFVGMVDSLRNNGIRVLVMPSKMGVVTPDAVFPNNWFSTHEDNTVVFYPMLNENRRLERQEEKVQEILKEQGITNLHSIDLTKEEDNGHILEGTGSMILDRINKKAFAVESTRTTKETFFQWCEQMGYEGILFHAYDTSTSSLYHTNLLMSIGDKFCVICLDLIPEEERKIVTSALTTSQKDIIPLTKEQVPAFCGNILQVMSSEGKAKIVMSEGAFHAFTTEQKETLKQYGDIISVPLPTIETVGGGSARCMMAEIFGVSY